MFYNIATMEHKTLPVFWLWVLGIVFFVLVLGIWVGQEMKKDKNWNWDLGGEELWSSKVKCVSFLRKIFTTILTQNQVIGFITKQ